jgi:hypothetical protein
MVESVEEVVLTDTSPLYDGGPAVTAVTVQVGEQNRGDLLYFERE